MEHRRLMILFAALSLFALGVILWYFLFSAPKPAPTLDLPTDPLATQNLPPRAGLIFQGNTPEVVTTTEVTDPRREPFVLIWGDPTAGNTFITKQVLRESSATTTRGTSTLSSPRTIRATTTTLLFVDRNTGHIYGYDEDVGSVYQVTNTTIPGIHDAYIWANGTRILMRYLDTDKKTIVSIMGTIPNTQATGDPEALSSMVFLPKNIGSVAVSQSTNSISYVVPNDAGGSVYTETLKGTSLTATLPFAEWDLAYGGELLYATTRASAYVEGSTILIPKMSRVVGGKTGLMTRPTSNGTMLHSMWSREGLVLFGSSGGTIVPVQVRTLASKCSPLDAAYFFCGIPKTLPSPNEGLPDDWYQGTTSFGDSLALVNAKNGESYTYFAFDEKYGDMDVTTIGISQNHGLISFIRKQDGGLYMINSSLF
jgi:hypothetical protein